VLNPQLAFFESLLRGKTYLPGQVFGIDDCGLWPVLRFLMQSDGEAFDAERFPNLATYYAKVGRRRCVRTVLADMNIA
jgi:glutathione S-transferase